MFFTTVAVALAAVATVVASPVPSTSSASAHMKRSKTYIGRATYFYTGLGACGGYNYNSQHIIALDASLYEAFDDVCGKWLTITNTQNHKSARGWIVDECPGCGYGSLDLSPSLFSMLGSESEGVLPIEWTVSGGSLKRSVGDSTEDDDEFPAELELIAA
ncbi:hypothetical protein FRB96_006288 [Tulasnella sp. 330]|nr:hypothetical protein FRB96_006288 [Tulasnella sp. 330]KAG8885105.1 hypothetical protein FRB97_002270 [Tulasnella sp. 331]KAG8890608.1 hypothetical protein FRB98_007163 [Tulasnella sp. 332]